MTDGTKYIDLIVNKIENWYTNTIIHLPNILVGLLFFFFIYKISTSISRFLEKMLRKKIPQSTDAIPTIMGGIRFFVILIGSFISLEIMGLSGFLWKFIGSLGVTGVIAGVALKDLVSSIFSGLLVGIDKAFKVGDYVTIKNYSGTVQDIGFLTTKILMDDGKKVYIPNQVIFSAPFFNVTASPQRRIILSIDIPSGEDLQIAQEAIITELKTLNGVDFEKNVEVVFVGISNGNFTLEVRFWIESNGSFLLMRSKALIAINVALEKNGIELSPPTSIQMMEKNKN